MALAPTDLIEKLAVLDRYDKKKWPVMVQLKVMSLMEMNKEL